MSHPACVLDASVAVSWCLKDENDRYAIGVLEQLHDHAVTAPAIWPLEVGNSLLVAERRARMTSEDLAQALGFLLRLPVECEHQDPGHCFSVVLPIAHEHGLSAYDASYLELAMREGLPLATMDTHLAHAARKCGVARYQPGGSRQ